MVDKIGHVLDGRFKDRNDAAHRLLAMHVATADRADFDALRQQLERATLAISVVAVDDFERVEPLGVAVTRGVSSLKRAHRMGQRQHGALRLGNAPKRLDLQQLRPESIEAEDEHVPHVRANFHPGQYADPILFAQRTQLVS